MRLATLVGALAALTAMGCSTPLVDRLDDSEAMRVAVLRLVPVGTSIDEAERRLGREGLTCGRPALGRFGDHGPLLFAHCEGRSRGLATYRRWQIALVDSAGRLSDVLVTS